MTTTNIKTVPLEQVPPEPEPGRSMCQVVNDQSDVCTLESGHQPIVIDSIPWHHVSHGLEMATVFQGGKVR